MWLLNKGREEEEGVRTRAGGRESERSEQSGLIKVRLPELGGGRREDGMGLKQPAPCARLLSGRKESGLAASKDDDVSS